MPQNLQQLFWINTALNTLFILRLSVLYNNWDGKVKKWLRVHETHRQKNKKSMRKRTPDVGIEPTTTRLKVERSTNWANRVLYYLAFLHYFISIFFHIPVITTWSPHIRSHSHPVHFNLRKSFCPYLIEFFFDFYTLLCKIQFLSPQPNVWYDAI